MAMLVYRSVVLVVSIQQGTFEYFCNEIVLLVVESVQHFSAIMLSLLISHYVHRCSTLFNPFGKCVFSMLNEEDSVPTIHYKYWLLRRSLEWFNIHLL